MVSWWDRAAGMGCVWLGTWWCFNFITKYEPINHDGFWNSHFLREVLSEKGNHEMNVHNSFLNNSNDFWDSIVRVWSDFGCTSWFWNHYLIWFCMNARPSGGGQDGHLNHACVLLSAVTGWNLPLVELENNWTKTNFQTKNLDVFLFPVGPLRERSRSHFPSDTGPSSAGERARHTWQLWLFCGDRLEPPASWAWKQLNHLETIQTKKHDDFFNFHAGWTFQREVSFFKWHWALLGRGKSVFFQQWQVGTYCYLIWKKKKWPKRATNLKKKHAGVTNWKKKGGASQGKRFHLVTLGPPRQGEAKHTW